MTSFDYNLQFPKYVNFEFKKLSLWKWSELENFYVKGNWSKEEEKNIFCIKDFKLILVRLG